MTQINNALPGSASNGAFYFLHYVLYFLYHCLTHNVLSKPLYHNGREVAPWTLDHKEASFPIPKIIYVEYTLKSNVPSTFIKHLTSALQRGPQRPVGQTAAGWEGYK